jgi:hypothetical protein
METAALQVAEEKGKQLGEVTGEAFTKRTVSETVAWLDRVQAVAEREPLSSKNLPALTGSWKNVVETGRTALGLDAQGPTLAVSVEAMLDICHGGDRSELTSVSVAVLDSGTRPELADDSSGRTAASGVAQLLPPEEG